MDQSFSAKKYFRRVAVELIVNGLVTLTFLTLLLFGILTSRLDITPAIIIGIFTIWFIAITIRRTNWHRIFITRLTLSDGQLRIEYLDKDTQQEPIIFNIEHSNIQFFGRGWGGANMFFRLTNGEVSLEQIQSGQWTNEAFANLLTSIKDVKGTKLTHDEQDWLNRLNKK